MANGSLTISAFDEIFSRVSSRDQYPSKDELRDIGCPFYEQLSDLAYMNKYKEHNAHVRDVVIQTNTLLKNSPSHLVSGLNCDMESLSERLDRMFLELPVWARHYKMESYSIVRAASVYHDIGKWIVKERHPTEGYYLLQYLFPQEREKLLSMIGRHAFDLLLTVIRDHDKFGIISTGEASLLAMVDMLNPARNEVLFYKMSVVTLMLTNFADIAVTAPEGFKSLQAQWIADDVEKILHALEDGNGGRLKVSWNFCEADREASRTTLRISRLVDSCYKNAKLVQKRRAGFQGSSPEIEDRFEEIDWEDINFSVIIDSVNRKLQTNFLGAAYQRFCIEFSHFCKFDYALYFFGEVARQLNIKRLKEEQPQYPIDDLVASVIHVLKSIVETYRELVAENEAIPRRIGIQMQSLLREGVKETVAGFIAGTKGPSIRDVSDVVSWITNEISTWLFIT